jgi:hypothetical protein
MAAGVVNGLSCPLPGASGQSPVPTTAYLLSLVLDVCSFGSENVRYWAKADIRVGSLTPVADLGCVDAG